MADTEKTAPAPEISSSTHSHAAGEDAGIAAQPTGWMYRSFKLGPLVAPYYASPKAQLLIVAFVCFLCPGMFNALNGMGGGGQLDHTANSKANTALYSTFAVVSFFAGTFTNKLGVKIALCVGGLGYTIYVASYLSYNHTRNLGFTTFAGALLGVCAGLLWTAQGTIMMSYPPENKKGNYIFWFWMIFNFGAVIGGFILLGLNINTTGNATVSDGTYVGFIILTALGAALTFALVDAKKVVRTDGSKIILMKSPTWKSELWGLVEVFKSDPYIVLLFPMFFASNWFYTYHFNDINGAKFNTRTRALNTVLYYLMQIVAALLFGWALDRPGLSRKTRAKACWVVLLVLTMVIWGGGYEFQKGYTRAQVTAGTATPDDPSDDYPVLDWKSDGYIGAMFLYMFYGFYDAAWQTCVYWYMGALTNNARKLANFAGFYKGIQSAGAAIIWRIDDLGVPYMNIFASCWALLVGSLIVAFPVIWFKVQETVPIEEDLKFSDETFEEVAPEKTLSHHADAPIKA